MLELRASRGVGKTRWIACMIIWWLETRENAVAIWTAPTNRQVEVGLGRNIRHLYGGAKKPLLGRPLTKQIELGPGWFGVGFSTTEPDKVQGFHEMRDVFHRNEHEGGVLVAVDEASGVPDPNLDALDGILTAEGSRLVYISNPLRKRGRAWEVHDLEEWAHSQVSAFDAPPELVSAKWIEDRRKLWGPDVERDPRWCAYVLGVYPPEDDDALFPISLLDRARHSDPQVEELRMGVDVARHGADRSVALLLKNGRVAQIAAWRTPDLMDTTRRVLRAAKVWGVPTSAIAIDIGMGAGVIDRLRELGHSPTAVDFGSSPLMDRADLYGRDAKFLNRRAELFWTIRCALVSGQLSISDVWHPLWTELQAFGYEYDRLEKMKVTSKDDLKSILGHSPDYADALACAMASPSRSRIFAAST